MKASRLWGACCAPRAGSPGWRTSLATCSTCLGSTTASPALAAPPWRLDERGSVRSRIELALQARRHRQEVVQEEERVALVLLRTPESRASARANHDLGIDDLRCGAREMGGAHIVSWKGLEAGQAGLRGQCR